MRIRFLLFLWALPLPAFCQTNAPCYQQYRNKGLEYMRQRTPDYGEAISQFVAGLVTCPDVPSNNDLGALIESAKLNWAKDLQQSVDEARKNYQKALDEKEKAEKSQQAEQAARESAEKNAQIAYTRGIRAESYRLALLADMMRQQDYKSDALLLAWMGLQLADTQQQYLVQAYSEAVIDSFFTPLYKSSKTIARVKLLPDRQTLLIKTNDEVYYLLQAGSRNQIIELPGPISGIQASADGKYLVVWNQSNVASVLDYEGRQIGKLSGHLEPVRDAVFSPNSQQVVTCSRDNTARIWNVNGELRQTLSGHTGNVQQVFYDAYGQFVFTRSTDGNAKIWESNGILRATLADTIHRILKLALGKQALFSLHANNQLQVWDFSGRSIHQLMLQENEKHILQSSPNQNLIGVLINDHTLAVFEGNGELKGRLIHPDKIESVFFCQHNDAIITVDRTNKIRVWAANGSLIQEYRGHRAPVYSADYATDQKLLISAAIDGTVKFWSANGAVLAEWSQAGTKAQVGFLPGEKQFYSTKEDGKSLFLAPVPQEVYVQTDPQALLNAPSIRRLIALFGIQFWPPKPF